MNKFYKAVAETLAIRYDTSATSVVEVHRQAELECILGMLVLRFQSEDKNFSEDQFMGYFRSHIGVPDGTSS